MLPEITKKYISIKQQKYLKHVIEVPPFSQKPIDKEVPVCEAPQPDLLLLSGTVRTQNIMRTAVL